MNSKIFSFFQKLLLVTFIIGVVFLFLVKSASEYLLSSMMSTINYALIVIWYLVGIMAITLNYLGEKALDKLEGSPNDNDKSMVGLFASTFDSFLIKKEYINDQLDSILNSEFDNRTKSIKFLSLLCNKMSVGKCVLFQMQIEEGIPKLKYFASYVKNMELSDKGWMHDSSNSGNYLLDDKEIFLSKLCGQQELLNSGLRNLSSDFIHLIPVQSESGIKGILELTFIEPINSDVKRNIENYVAKISLLL